MQSQDDLSDFLTNYLPPRDTAGRAGSPITQDQTFLGHGSPSPITSSESRLHSPSPLTGTRYTTPGDNVNESETDIVTTAPPSNSIDPELRLISFNAQGTPEPLLHKRCLDLQQYSNHEVISKKLKGEHKEAFIKWTKVSPTVAQGAAIISTKFERIRNNI